MTSHKPVCGIDLVRDERISSASFEATRYFHEDELDSEKLVSIFALKEAALKACGLDHAWLDVHVVYEEGKPTVTVRSFEGEPSCSVSHEDGFTVAMVYGWS